MIGFILGPDRNSGSGPLRYPFRWNLGWYRFNWVPVHLAGTRLVQQFFLMLYLGFMMSYLHHVPPPVLWLDHVHPSSSQTESRATLQFPDCITCFPPVPWLYHMLPSSSQTVSRATLEFTKCIMSPPPFGDTWRGILSLFSPFVTFIDFILSKFLHNYTA